MPPRKASPNRNEILQGTLDLLILTTLKWGPQHGYALSLAIRANSLAADSALLTLAQDTHATAIALDALVGNWPDAAATHTGKSP